METDIGIGYRYSTVLIVRCCAKDIRNDCDESESDCKMCSVKISRGASTASLYYTSNLMNLSTWESLAAAAKKVSENNSPYSECCF